MQENSIENKKRRAVEEKAREEGLPVSEDGAAAVSRYVGPTGLGGFDPDTAYEYKERKLIPDCNYFMKGPYHHYNNDDTCTTVATQILLGYNNWSKDGRLITNPQFLYGRSIVAKPNTNPVEYYTGCHPNIDNVDFSYPYNYAAMSTSEYFFEELVSKIDPGRDGASLDEAFDGIGWYLSNYASASFSYGYYYNVPILFPEYAQKKLRDVEIKEGRPAIAGIYHSKPNLAPDETHAVVVYGYQKFNVGETWIEGFIAHFGWKRPGSEHMYKWFNSSWVYGYLYMKTSHQHTDLVDPNIPYVSECSVCHRRVCNLALHPHVYDYCKKPYNLSAHWAYCSCMERIQEPHTFDKIGIPNWLIQVGELFHKAKCACGEETEQQPHNFDRNIRKNYLLTGEVDLDYHLADCKCTITGKKPHSFFDRYEFDNVPSGYCRFAYCACGFSVLAEHVPFWKPGYNACMYCWKKLS